MQHLCVSIPVNPFHKIVPWRFLVLIIMMLLHNIYIRAHNRYNHVCLRGVCADGNVPVMTFPWVFACAWTLGCVASFAYSTCICA